MASATAVLPEEASRIVLPGISCPAASASAIIEAAARSFTEPPGLNHSAFASSRTPFRPSPICVSGSSGVLPIRSSTLLAEGSGLGARGNCPEPPALSPERLFVLALVLKLRATLKILLVLPPESQGDPTLLRRHGARIPRWRKHDVHRGLLDARQGLQDLLHRGFQLRPVRAERRRERHRQLHVLAFRLGLDIHTVDEPEVHDAQMQLRVLDRLQGVHDLSFVQRHVTTLPQWQSPNAKHQTSSNYQSANPQGGRPLVIRSLVIVW